MDPLRPSPNNALVLHGAEASTASGSQGSSSHSEQFEDGDWVRLLVPGFGEVGVEVIKDVRPQGQWFGVPILVEPFIYMLVRPQSIKMEFWDLLYLPAQRFVRTLADANERIVLWRAADIVRSSGDPPMDPLPYVRLDAWFGLDVQRRDGGGVPVSAGRLICWKSDAPFQDETLGEGFVGVLVLEVYVGNDDAVMSYERWPLSECWFTNGRSLKDTVDHFAAFPDVDDPLAYLGGRMKAPYRFVIRQPSLEEKESLYDRKTTEEEIRKVSSEKCCNRLCCQHFNQYQTLLVRQKYYLKSFEDRREYGISAGGQLHHLGGNSKRMFITLAEVEVCGTAWYIIHGIPKSTYHRYIDNYKEGRISGAHGNKGIKRPRLRTVQATGTMKAIIDENADQMPHQMRAIGNGRMDTLKYLPAGRNWKRVRTDANELNADYGLPPVNQSTISRLKKEHFNNVYIKPVGSSFAKCSTCDQLQLFILKSPKGSPAYVEFMKQRTQHLNHQASCRRLYASWREESKCNPQEIICIIHDKMDTAKTALPRMRVTTKATAGLGQLPMSVTGMVAHGHGDGAYAHYAPSCWPGDSNFTISSLARLLCRLEGPPIREASDLFPYPPANSLFEALLRGKSRCMDSLTLTDPRARVGCTPLPRKLYLQLDNSAKDNKNQYLMAFLSLLTARGVFQEIQVGFLLVGHTHEDIDAYFSHLSKALKSKNTFVVADLMQAFMQSQELSFMPEFIQEVGDFKSFIKGYQSTGTSRLIGLEEMHLFKFFVDMDGVPVMQYKKSTVDSQWLPADKPSLRLWKRDQSGRPMLPTGCPKHVPFKPMWGSEVPKATGNQEKATEVARRATVNKGFMLVGLEKYIQYWKNGMSKCEGFATAFGPYVEYWERVLLELKEPLPECPSELVEGFWPQHDWRLARRDSPRSGVTVNPMDVIPEEENLEPYCGPANEAPRESFNPWLDIRPGSWVLVRPNDPAVCAVWQGRALSTVCRVEGDANNGKFLMQYWRPDNSKSSLEERYRNCWYGKWVVENTPPAWVDATSVVYSNWSKITDPKTRTIPKKSREAALANLNRANEVDP